MNDNRQFGDAPPSRLLRGWWLRLALAATSCTAAFAADAASSRGRANNLPVMEGVVYGLFDDATGGRIGRLQIDQVKMEFRRQGFLRVAWQPLAVLEGVSLDIGAGAKWPEAGRQIIDALQGGRGREVVLRRVHLVLPGSPATNVKAATAHLRPDGALVLDAAAVDAGGDSPTSPRPSLCFWLAGKRAGQLTSADSVARAPVASRPALSSAQEIER